MRIDSFRAREVLRPQAIPSTAMAPLPKLVVAFPLAAPPRLRVFNRQPCPDEQRERERLAELFRRLYAEFERLLRVLSRTRKEGRQDTTTAKSSVCQQLFALSVVIFKTVPFSLQEVKEPMDICSGYYQPTLASMMLHRANHTGST